MILFVLCKKQTWKVIFELASLTARSKILGAAHLDADVQIQDPALHLGKLLPERPLVLLGGDEAAASCSPAPHGIIVVYHPGRQVAVIAVLTFNGLQIQ